MKKKKVNIIAILSYGRSGTGLISSLFDGHRDISIFPDHITQNLYSFWDFYKKEDKNYIFKKFVEIYEILFEPKIKKNYFHKSVGIIGSAYQCGFCELGENKNIIINADKKKFIKYLKSFFLKKKFNRKNFFIAIHYAYNFSVFNKKKTNYIFYNLHVPSKKIFNEFLKDFPDAIFIQTLREPLSGMYSMFRAFNERSFFDGNYIFSIINMIKERGNYNFLNKKKLIYLKLENLHKDSARTIKLLCKKISVPFRSNLLKSTINGLKWHNEVGKTLRISGFSKKIINQNYEDYFWIKDDFIFYKFFREKYEQLSYKKKNYDFIFSKLIFYICLFLPFKIEVIQLKKKQNIKKLFNLFVCYLKIRFLIFKFINKPKKFKIN